VLIFSWLSSSEAFVHPFRCKYWGRCSWLLLSPSGRSKAGHIHLCTHSREITRALRGCTATGALDLWHSLVFGLYNRLHPSRVRRVLCHVVQAESQVACFGLSRHRWCSLVQALRVRVACARVRRKWRRANTDKVPSCQRLHPSCKLRQHYRSGTGPQRYGNRRGNMTFSLDECMHSDHQPAVSGSTCCQPPDHSVERRMGRPQHQTMAPRL